MVAEHLAPEEKDGRNSHTSLETRSKRIIDVYSETVFIAQIFVGRLANVSKLGYGFVCIVEIVVIRCW